MTDEPGPGKYDPKLPEKQSFARPRQDKKGEGDVDHEKSNKRRRDGAEYNVDPGTYNPNYVSHVSRSAPFSMAAKGGRGPAVDDGTELSTKIRNVQQKKREQVQYMGVPGPQYNIPGDFDFPDPRKPDEQNAVGMKKPKFAFGMKFNQRAKNLDMPGPGEYEVDVPPMNHKNPAYWIGTDVRKDLGVPFAHMYPGPGEYEVNEEVQGPAVSFPKEQKITSVEKTNDPGPGTYATFDTVGLMPAYQDNGANARVV